jgi:hypothetical protein
VAGAAGVSLLAIWKASRRAAILHSPCSSTRWSTIPLSPTSPLGDSVDVFVCREEAERFIEEVRGDDPGLAKPLRIEERELEAGATTNPSRSRTGPLRSHRYGDSNASHVSPSGTPALFPPKMTTRVLEASHATGAEWRCGPMS